MIASYRRKWIVLSIVILSLYIVFFHQNDEDILDRDTEWLPEKTTTERINSDRCLKPENGKHLCYCGSKDLIYDRLLGEICYNGQIDKK